MNLFKEFEDYIKVPFIKRIEELQAAHENFRVENTNLKKQVEDLDILITKLKKECQDLKSKVDNEKCSNEVKND